MRSIDGYDLVRELARGGMGVVYEARDRATARPVALKLLLSVSDPDARARFRVEGEATARLRHPGIVAVHAMGESGGAPYLVMDLVKGDTLESRLKRGGPFAPREAARIAELAASALEHAHAQGIVHRDLKPSNVMIDDTGRPLLTDFGVAKLSDGAPLTRTGDLLGTPSFMAPEQLDGRRADARTDVYGLGATLFALLTGQPPFTGPVMQVLSALVNKPAPRPSSLRPDVPRALDDLVLACLQKDPAKRPTSMKELTHALADVLDVIDAAPARSSLARPLLLAAVALALVGGGVALVASRSPVEHEPALVKTRPPARFTPPVAPVTTRATAPVVAPKVKREPLSGEQVLRVHTALMSGGPVDDEEVERLLVSAENSGDTRLLADALEARAKRRCAAKQLVAALDDFDRLRAVSPERAATCRHLRLAVVVDLDRDEALQEYEEYLALPDTDPNLLINLARGQLGFLQKRGRLAEGRAAMAAVLFRMPAGDDRLVPEWWQHCANAEQEGFLEAVDVLGKLIEGRPSASRLRYRGIALVQLGREREAIADIERAIALEPANGELLVYRARWTRRTGDVAGMVATLEQAAQVEPASAALRGSIAAAYEDWGLPAEAVVHRREAVRLEPNAENRAALAKTEERLRTGAAPPR